MNEYEETAAARQSSRGFLCKVLLILDHVNIPVSIGIDPLLNSSKRSVATLEYSHYPRGWVTAGRNCLATIGEEGLVGGS